MANPILVTGGTGMLGRVLVQRLLDDGQQVRVLSRRPAPDGPLPYQWAQGDLRADTGLAEALSGVDTVIHCASNPRGGDVESAGNLIKAARRAGMPHLVYISIVGIERVPLGYYRTKLAVEKLIEDSGLPWSVLRTTQWHDLLLSGWRMLSRSPVMPVPNVPVQPVDVREVAQRLAGLAAGAPAGRVPDLAGPQVRGVVELAKVYLAAMGRRRLVLPVRLPGKAFRGYRNGGHLAPDRAVGQITYEQCLSERIAAERGTEPKPRQR